MSTHTWVCHPPHTLHCGFEGGVVHGPNYTPGKWFRARRGPPDQPLSQCISPTPGSLVGLPSPGDWACKPTASFFDPMLYV